MSVYDHSKVLEFGNVLQLHQGSVHTPVRLCVSISFVPFILFRNSDCVTDPFFSRLNHAPLTVLEMNKINN